MKNLIKKKLKRIIKQYNTLNNFEDNYFSAVYKIHILVENDCKK